MQCGIGLYAATPILALLGMVQGSPLAPGICNMCCIVSEHISDVIPKNVSFLDICFQRWVDDIYVIIIAWAESPKVATDVLCDKCFAVLGDIFELYGIVFGMKDQDPSSCVPLDVCIKNNAIVYVPCALPTHSLRFPYHNNAKPNTETRQNVIF